MHSCHHQVSQTYRSLLARKCMTLWGKPDRVHTQNMEQLHALDCHQNVAEPQATENHITYTGTVSQAWL